MLAALTVAVAWLMAERRALKRRLRRHTTRDAQLYVALEPAPVGLFDVDLDTFQIKWSRLHEELFGYRPGEFDGTPEAFRARLHPDDREATIRLLAEARRHGQPYELECRAVHPNGTVRRVVSRGRCFHDARGRPQRVLGTVFDATARERVANELRLTMQARTTFLRNISHETRTPLTAIVGFAGELGKLSGLDADSMDMIKRIEQNGERLLSLVDNSLTLTEAEAGRVGMHVQHLPLRRLLASADAQLRPLAERKGLTLAWVVEERTPHLIGTDPQLFQRLLVCLVDNALKFTERGGAVVRLSPDERAYRGLSIRVEDTGAGIPMDARRWIFEPFAMAQAELGRVAGSGGTGLALARHLASMLGGMVELTGSIVGHGSVFTATVNNAADASPSYPSYPSSPQLL